VDASENSPRGGDGSDVLNGDDFVEPEVVVGGDAAEDGGEDYEGKKEEWGVFDKNLVLRTARNRRFPLKRELAFELSNHGATLTKTAAGRQMILRATGQTR
jgi:hypothetical protein